MALTLAAAFAFGLLPAIRFSRPELVSSLKDRTGVGGRRVGRVQRFAASAQTGVALISLVIGALFLRSLSTMAGGELGFDPDGMVVTDFRTGALSSALLDLSEEGYPTLEEEAGAFLDRLSNAIRAVPGVASLAFADGVPLDGSRAYASASRVGQFDVEGGRVSVEYTRATEGYFAAIGTPILQGRGFESADDAASLPVAVITESLADRLWPGEAALGRQFSWPVTREERRAVTVIGVVGNVASSRATEDRPHVFIPLRQEFSPRLMVVVRARAGASTLGEPIRAAMRAVDPGLPMPRLVTAESMVARSTQGQRGAARLGGGLGLMTLLLSAIGVYGVVSLAVANRTSEIGIRMAMGATRQQIHRAVLADAVRLAIPGLVVGALLAAGTAVAMRSELFGLSPLDPLSFLSAAGVLLLVVLAASLVPARRASGIHPVAALREE